MALPPWTIELLRRGINDVAKKASEPQTLAKIKSQASEILQELPETAARGIDAVMRSAEAGKQSMQRWTRKHTELAIPVMNASGVLINEWGTGVPLAHSVTEIGHEFNVDGVLHGSALDEKLGRRIAKLLPVGDEYALAVSSSFSAAMAAFSLTVGHTELVIHRNHAVRLPDGRALPEAFGLLVPVIREVGAVGHVSSHDFDGLERFCAILADNGTKPVELLDLGTREFSQAVVLPVGTLAAGDSESIPSQGADMVILRGDGVAGGPPCGILVGRREWIELIESSPAWPSLAASDAMRAMTVVALEVAANGQSQSPLQHLLAGGEDNLRGRAERMATRLTGSDSIASCQVTAEDARLTADGRWRFPSRQLRLRHANRNAADWSSRLREQRPAVVATADGDDLKVDLRWISAADDGKLAEALGGKSMPEPVPDTVSTEAYDSLG